MLDVLDERRTQRRSHPSVELARYASRFSQWAVVIALILLSVSATPVRAGVPPAPASEQHSVWIAVAARERLDPLWLYAMAIQESRKPFPDGRLRPWPWALHTPAEGSLYLQSYDQALKKLKELLAAGVTNIDVGVMQVNWQFQGHRVEDVAALLMPARNIEVSARILREHLDELGGDLRLALARYHSPRPERGLPYAASVLAILEQLRRVDGLTDALAIQSPAAIQE